MCSPIGDIFRARIRQFPALVNCCTIDWFCPWPDAALQVCIIKCDTAKNILIPVTVVHRIYFFSVRELTSTLFDFESHLEYQFLHYLWKL